MHAHLLIRPMIPHPREWFELLMGPEYPGLMHYWGEVSYNVIDLTGSVVVGWYDLPHPRAAYLAPGGFLNNSKSLEDCTTAADAEVFFPAFAGIILMLAEVLDRRNQGGSTTLSRDGQTKAYGVVWMQPSGRHGHYLDQGVLAHEMGHVFGLLHSSGPESAPFTNSGWDVMSGLTGHCFHNPERIHPDFGCPAQHPIVFHKDLLGWLPPGRKYIPTPGGIRKYKATFRLAAPAGRLRRRPPRARGVGGCPSTPRWSAAVGATRRGAAMRRLDRRRRIGYAASGVPACQGLGTAGAEERGSFTAIVVILSLHGEAKCHS
jgi:hypothetical protein